MTNMIYPRLEEAKKAFIIVRDYYIANGKTTTQAYRLAWKKPLKFFIEHTTEEAIEILEKEATP